MKRIWLALIIAGICIVSSIGISKIEKDTKLTLPEQTVLNQFKTSSEQFTNGMEKISPDLPTVKILFLGNSITYHPPIKEEKDKRFRGLLSTTLEKDYVHLLVKRIAQEKQVNVIYSIINIAGFEKNFTKIPFDFSLLSQVEVKDPDYVIFQIGENVSIDDLLRKRDLFIQRYTQLVNHFEQSTKIICLPWWPDPTKNGAITQVAILTHSYLVDIGHLGSGLDNKNFALSHKEYSLPMADEHPGDYGMQNIADMLWTVFNAQPVIKAKP